MVLELFLAYNDTHNLNLKCIIISFETYHHLERFTVLIDKLFLVLQQRWLVAMKKMVNIFNTLSYFGYMYIISGHSKIKKFTNLTNRDHPFST